MAFIGTTSWDCAEDEDDSITIENEFTGANFTALVTVYQNDEERMMVINVDSAVSIRNHLNKMLEGL